MSYPTMEAETIAHLVHRLESVLPEQSVECIFEFGSTARGEAATSSDIDLWVLVNSPRTVYIDKALASDDPNHKKLGRTRQALLKKMHPAGAVYCAGLIFTVAQFKFSLGLFFLGAASLLLFKKTSGLIAPVILHIGVSVASVLLVAYYLRLVTLLGFLF